MQVNSETKIEGITLNSQFTELFENSKKRDAFPMNEAETRNILFVGKSRTGKSTVLNVLKNPIYLSGTLNIFAETKDPNLHTISIKYEKDVGQDINFVLNIIDTPGLFETHQTGNEEMFRDNEVLKKLIKKCLQSEIKSVHAIFFVCSFSSGVDKDQLEAFVEFTKLFEGAEDKFALIITRAEDFTVRRKEELMQDIENEPRMKEFLDKIGGKANIFFTGCVPKNDIDRGFLGSVEKKAANVFDMRRKIYDFLFESKKSSHLSSIKQLSHYERNTVKSVESFEVDLKSFSQLLEQENWKQANILKNTLNLKRKEIEENIQFLHPDKNKEDLSKFNKNLTIFKEKIQNNCVQLLECDIGDYFDCNVEVKKDMSNQKAHFELQKLEASIKSTIEGIERNGKMDSLVGKSFYDKFLNRETEEKK